MRGKSIKPGMVRRRARLTPEERAHNARVRATSKALREERLKREAGSASKDEGKPVQCSCGRPDPVIINDKTVSFRCGSCRTWTDVEGVR